MVKNVASRLVVRTSPSALAEAATPDFALSRVAATATVGSSGGTSTGVNTGLNIGIGTPPTALQNDGRGLDDIGPRLGEMRRALGMTQLDVAFKMGTTQPALARLEKGDAKANLRTLSRYAAALGRRAVVQLTPSTDAVPRRLGDSRVASAPANAATSLTAAARPGGTRMVDLEALPAALASMRKERGVTQSEVANRMATTQPVIARLESGDGVPNLTTLERFSQAIGASLGVSFELPL
jgi:transcriptional regulator with XRE-family HTH domain